MRLNITKTQKQYFKNTSTTVYSRTQTGTETVVYNIEVLNRSAGGLDNLKVKWAVIIRSGSGADKLVEGGRGTNLAFGQKFMFDTDPIDLRVTKSENRGNYRSRYGAEVDGCLVQVFVDDKLIAQESQPNDVAERIESLRAAAGQKRHQF